MPMPADFGDRLANALDVASASTADALDGSTFEPLVVLYLRNYDPDDSDSLARTKIRNLAPVAYRMDVETAEFISDQLKAAATRAKAKALHRD
jgi:hypothetical protein